MSASNSSGIQTLLEAEHKAQGIVQEARAYRTDRLRASKLDALAEVEEYKRKKEAEFANASAKNVLSSEKIEALAVDNSKEQIDELRTQSMQKIPDVVDYLISQVSTSKEA